MTLLEDRLRDGPDCRGCPGSLHRIPVDRVHARLSPLKLEIRVAPGALVEGVDHRVRGTLKVCPQFAGVSGGQVLCNPKSALAG